VSPDPTRAERVLLLVGGVIMTAVGVLFLVAPTTLEQGMGVMQPEAPARTEIRAVYGGIELAVGAFLLWCWRVPRHAASGVLFAALFALGAGLGRVVGFAVEGAVDPRNLTWGALELAGGAYAAWLVIKRGR